MLAESVGDPLPRLSAAPLRRSVPVHAKCLPTNPSPWSSKFSRMPSVVEENRSLYSQCWTTPTYVRFCCRKNASARRRRLIFSRFLV